MRRSPSARVCADRRIRVRDARGEWVAAQARRATGAIVASTNLGKNPRHVSVNADGTLVYVSRFITPPLPGESTAQVLPTGAGGEVVVVSAGSMTVSNTIRLAHSNKPDFEIQGSGRA
jgi:hypothetical protein